MFKSLPVGKAAGPDGINNRILRELARELSVSFCCLFNRSHQIGEFPDYWKQAHVSPTAKSGNRSNYRPISVLRNPEKCFERDVFKHLYNHFHDNQILTSLQSGFIPGDSTVNQLTFLQYLFSSTWLWKGSTSCLFWCKQGFRPRLAWRSSLKTWSGWYQRFSAYLVPLLSIWSESCLTWRRVKMERNSRWSTSRLNSGTASLFTLYKRYCKGYWLQYTSFCRWH